MPRAARPEFIVFSREGIERYEPTDVEVCISITDPDATPARLSPRFTAVLRLSFSDIVEAQAPEDVLFAREHAAAVADFLERFADVDRVVVHCNAGWSRSPGVVLGLCDRLGRDVAQLENAYPGWNRHVRALMNAISGGPA